MKDNILLILLITIFMISCASSRLSKESRIELETDNPLECRIAALSMRQQQGSDNAGNQAFALKDKSICYKTIVIKRCKVFVEGKIFARHSDCRDYYQ